MEVIPWGPRELRGGELKREKVEGGGGFILLRLYC